MSVFISITYLVGIYGFYTIGYEKGLDEGLRQCPPISQKMHLYSITENKDGIRCQYENPRRKL
jgi:hypothetical protein